MIKRILDWVGFTLFVFSSCFLIMAGIIAALYLVLNFLIWEWLPLPDWSIVRGLTVFSVIFAARLSYGYFQEEVLE